MSQDNGADYIPPRGSKHGNQIKEGGKSMKKLFVGSYRGIPVALLTITLLVILTAGSVLAVNGGYVLWEGTGAITVDEPITISYGATQATCDTELVLGDPMPSVFLWPGVCVESWMLLESGAPHDLLIEAHVLLDGSPVDPMALVSLVCFDEFGAPSDILAEDGGVLVNSTVDVYVQCFLCVDGAAPPGVHNVSVQITRESPVP